jgi:ATP-dependent Lon protease
MTAAALSRIPYINIRNLVVFPGMETCLYIGRDPSLRAIEAVLRSKDQQLLLVSQRLAQENEVTALSQMYQVGTICNIERAVRMDDAMKIFVAGQGRFKIDAIGDEGDVSTASGSPVDEPSTASEPTEADCSDVVALLKSWCRLMRSDADENAFKQLLRPTYMSAYITRVAAMTSFYKLDGADPDQDLVAAAKKGFGASYQESFDRNKDAINLIVAGRQKLLEEIGSGSAIHLLKEVLQRELKAFSSRDPSSPKDASKGPSGRR